MNDGFGSVSRRAVLGIAALAAAPGLAVARPDEKIVILGAGMAGLAAGRALQEAGYAVEILEARDRIGGRIWTSRVWPGAPVDLGASWIHGDAGNPITALADAANARRAATQYDASITLDENGVEIDPDADPNLKWARSRLKAARKAAETRDQDMSLAAAIEALPDWSGASAAQRRAMRNYVNDTIEQEYGGDWTQISSWSYDDGQEYDGEDVLFPDGYDAAPRFLARGLSIRTGAVVTRIDPGANGVTLTLTSGERIAAARVIVTAPPSVLRSGALRLGEALAPARAAALAAIPMGLLNKCWLRFDDVAWPDDVDWIDWSGPEIGVFAQWVSLGRVLGAPILLAFHAGAQARAAERMSDAEMMSGAHAALRRMFGSDFPAPRAVQATRWASDPFALGSYSFNGVGVSRKTRAALSGADWDGRLIFAGEATSAKHAGTVHGAYLSGLAAARTVMAG